MIPSLHNRRNLPKFSSRGIVYVCGKYSVPVVAVFLAADFAGITGSKVSRRKFHTCIAQCKQQNSMPMATLETLNFDNLALRTLPIDLEKENFRRQVSGACFSKVKPTPLENPQTVAYAAKAMQLLDLPDSEFERPDFAEYFSGNKILPGADPAAHCYCGHQFGNFAGQLGDGATMYLGEVVNKKGERWEIQFKGAGKTPYSRTADGRKVLRSSIREFLCSEAIHHLGIPTTRAGTCVTSDSKVIRDIFYDGNAKEEQCTVILRIAETFIRFGSFEIFKPLDGMTGRKGPSVGRTDILEVMLEYTIKTFYPEIWECHQGDAQKMYLEFYKEVIRRTARLVAEWQCVGWCHGVLNTDNMSILGLTIDYGPYGFLDRYDPDFICNGSDDMGRYSYQKQPEICKWNCMKLGESIKMALPLEVSQPDLEIFDLEYKKHYLEKMRKKFGLQMCRDGDKRLFDSFLDTMYQTGADFTNCFRALSQVPLPGEDGHAEKLKLATEYLLSQCCSVDELKIANRPRMHPMQLQMMVALLQSNPSLLAQLGGGAGQLQQEIERMEKLRDLQNLTTDEKRQTDADHWTAWLKQYQDRLQTEVEGIEDLNSFSNERIQIMNSNNPKFILRNYIAQNAIEAAEKGDYSEVKRVLRLLENPYSETVDLGDLAVPCDGVVGVSTDADAESSAVEATPHATSEKVSKTNPSFAEFAYDSRPPQWAHSLRVT